MSVIVQNVNHLNSRILFVSVPEWNSVLNLCEFLDDISEGDICFLNRTKYKFVEKLSQDEWNAKVLTTKKHGCARLSSNALCLVQ